MSNVPCNCSGDSGASLQRSSVPRGGLDDRPEVGWGGGGFYPLPPASPPPPAVHPPPVLPGSVRVALHGSVQAVSAAGRPTGLRAIQVVRGTCSRYVGDIRLLHYTLCL